MLYVEQIVTETYGMGYVSKKTGSSHNLNELDTNN